MGNNTEKFQFSGQSGLNGYAVIRDVSSNVWNGLTIVVFAAGDYEDYGIDMAEQGSSGYYVVAIPTSLPVGRYHITYQHKAGATKVQTDRVIFQALIDWDGSTAVDSLIQGSGVADICNMALSHLGSGVSISNLETDVSEEAVALRVFYENARLHTLRAFPWPFAKRFSSLSLVEEEPTSEWDYSYRYPNSAILIMRILSGWRTDTDDTVVPYKIVSDSSGRLIYTDMEDAEIEYVFNVSNPLRFPPDFVSAFSYFLAFKIASKLTSGDAFKLGQKAFEMYTYEIRNAYATAINEEADDRIPESEFIRAR